MVNSQNKNIIYSIFKKYLTNYHILISNSWVSFQYLISLTFHGVQYRKDDLLFLHNAGIFSLASIICDCLILV